MAIESNAPLGEFSSSAARRLERAMVLNALNSDRELAEIKAVTDSAMPASGRSNPDAAVFGIDIELTAVLGSATLLVNQLLKLGRGAIVQLDQSVGDPIDLRANGRVVAKGEIVVVDDRLAISISELQARKK